MKFACFVAVVLTGTLLVACSNGGQPSAADKEAAGAAGQLGAVVQVKLRNWTVEPSRVVVPAGRVSFTAVHENEHAHGGLSEGGAIHELLVAAEDPSGSANFETVILRIGNLKPGESKTEAVMLQAGTYELSCRIGEAVGGRPVSHYEKGMRTTITVA